MRLTESLLTISLLAAAPSMGAQGDVIRPAGPHGGVRTTSLTVKVEVVDGVATTRMSQTIRNDTALAQAEATFLLPLPAGAVADDFRMLVNGEEVKGEVLGADRARDVYESIVRRRRDPGLLEYVGRGCLRGRVFPIPAGGEVGVEVSYRHVLPHSGGLTSWAFPARSAGVDGKTPEHVVLDFALTSRRPIKNAFSPLAAVEVLQPDDLHVRASFEGRGAELPERDLALHYGLSNEDFGLNLLTHRSGGFRGTDADEGTFLMLVSPKRDWKQEVVVEKEITFVLDTSGSMAGRKIEQAKKSLEFFLHSLRDGDRFNVVPFSTEARPFFPAPVEATAENRERALELAAKLEAVGGTNLEEALRTGLRRTAAGSAHVPLLVLLTDGLPTVGVTSPSEVLASVRKTSSDETRVFVLGVGNDVNTVLLDTLAEKTRGTRNYVRPEEDIEREAGALLTKLSNPVLTDLALEVEGIQVSRIVPKELADLFEGERLEVLGRYTGAGPAAIRLTGTLRGARREFVFEGTFAAEQTSFDFLPALWAERRVGLLLDAIRLNGPDSELLAEVERLGREFHIVTPYTSHLIVEEGLQVAQGPASREGGAFRGPGDTGASPVDRPVTSGGAGGPTGASNPSPSPSPSPPMSPGTSSSGADGFFLGRGAAGDREADLARIARGLRENEVLPENADDTAYTELARQVAEELRSARVELSTLGNASAVGEDAVARSRYLDGLVRGASCGEPKALHELFTRRVAGKVFRLRKGVWTDRDFDPAESLERLRVEAYSDEYFALVRRMPAIVPYLVLGDRVLVVLDGRVVEIAPPAAVE